jgi:putative nucleotidyltransferase with HDIG domain
LTYTVGPRGSWIMNTLTKLYLASVVGLASILALWELQSGFPPVTFSMASGAFCLAGLGVVSEMLAIHFRIGSSGAAASIRFIPLIASILLFPPPVELLVCVTMGVIAEIMVFRRTGLKSAFNVAQAVLSTVVAGIVYRSLYESIGLTSLGKIVCFTALAGTFFFTNQLLVSIALSLIQKSRFLAIFSLVIGPSGTNVLYDCLLSPAAVVLAVAFNLFDLVGLLVVSLPLLLLRHSYLSIQKLQRANADVLRILIKTIETRDSYTSGHSVRVSQLARAIAQDLKLRPSQVDDIGIAALLHDVGKIDSLYADLIAKQSGLTESERGVIRTHSAKGADFLRTFSCFKEPVVTSVRHHHERWDGKGYPDRLAGERIPLPARIIMLCDSIDAMLSDRPYRRAMTIDQVRAELVRCAGSQFDPSIVRIILQRNTLERAERLADAERPTFAALSAVG